MTLDLCRRFRSSIWIKRVIEHDHKLVGNLWKHWFVDRSDEGISTMHVVVPSPSIVGSLVLTSGSAIEKACKGASFGETSFNAPLLENLVNDAYRSRS